MAGRKAALQGWSHSATRSNLRFLRSVTLSGLTGTGFTFTLTLRTCPPSHALWQRLRKAYCNRLYRAGALRIHWVTEWQRRGVPHLHGCAYFPEPVNNAEFAARHRLLERAWLEVAAEYEPAPWCQTVRHVHDALGWFQYVAKHAARGVKHYQRSSNGIPREWLSRTGRMWGHIGTWEIREGIKLEVSESGFFAFRRIVQKWRYADARAKGDRARMKAASNMLRSPKREISRIKGVSEWVPEQVTLLILDHLASRGYGVEC